jgi:hypothetical protein
MIAVQVVVTRVTPTVLMQQKETPTVSQAAEEEEEEEREGLEEAEVLARIKEGKTNEHVEETLL